MPTLPAGRPVIDRRPKTYRPSSTARGYGEEHKRLRRQVLTDSPLCSNCRAAWATDLHHRNGDNRNTDPGNLTGWCGPCHDRHHARR